MNGIINLYKPSGMTSSDAVVKVKKILNERTIGHMGTLDPMGEGVLPLGVGKSARLFNYFLNKDKLYKATFKFGYETDTLDSCGKIIADGGRVPGLEEVKNASKNFIGEILQIPPKYSAKSIDGVKAYKRARQGEEFALKPVKINIYSLRVQTDKDQIELIVNCSAGTYIRSLGRDLAYSLNTYATMTSITRLKSGNFSIDDCVDFEEIERYGEKTIISPQEVLKDVPRIEVPSEFYDKLNNGVKLPMTPFDDKRTIFCREEFFGLGSAPQGFLKIETYLKD